MRLKGLNHSCFLWLLAAALCLPARGADNVIIFLRNGDRISGTIRSETTNGVVLTTPWVKELLLPHAQILKREAVPGPAAAVAKAPPPPASAVGVGATAGTSSPQLKKPAQLWAGEVNLGTDLGFSEKNRQLYTARAKIILAYERLKNTFDYDFSYGRNAGIQSANRMDGFSKSDVDFGRRFYLYNLVGAGYDAIRKIDLRYEIGPGAGYHLVKLTNFALNAEFGVDYQGQQLTDGTSTDLFFYRIAENFNWQLNAKLTLDHKFEFFPQVEDVELYRFRFESNLRYWLLSNLSLNLTVIDQYDSHPPDSVTRNDLQVRSSVGVKF